MHATSKRDVGALEGAGTRAQNSASRRVLGHEIKQSRRDRFRRENGEHFGRHQSLGHPRGGRRCEAVHSNVVLRAFDGKRLHQTHQRHLGGTVVGLPKIAIQTGRRGGHHDAPVLLRTHDVPHRLGANGCTHQMHVKHQTKIAQCHFAEAFVAQNARVVNQNIDAAPRVNRSSNHGGNGDFISHRSVIGNSRSTCGTYLIDHPIGGGQRSIASPRCGEAKIIDYDFRATRGECERVLSAEAAASAGNNGHFAVKTNTHAVLSRSGRSMHPHVNHVLIHISTSSSHRIKRVSNR